MALKIPGFLDILSDQVVPSRPDDLAFLVVQVLQEVLIYPNLESLGLLLVLLHLFYLAALSTHLSLEVLEVPWDPLGISLGVLFLQVVQAALDLLGSWEAWISR